jgi:hypothetical protein
LHPVVNACAEPQAPMPGAHGHHEHRNVLPERLVATRQSRHRPDRNTSAPVINPNSRPLRRTAAQVAHCIFAVALASSRHWLRVTFVSRDHPDAAALDSLRGDPADGSAQLNGTARHPTAPPGTAFSNSNPPGGDSVWVRAPPRAPSVSWRHGVSAGRGGVARRSMCTKRAQIAPRTGRLSLHESRVVRWSRR